MKKIICSLFAVSAFAASAQSGAKYSTGGNATNPGDVFGTTNSQPLNFVTNNVLRMVLDVNGQLKVVNLAGTGNRFLQSDATGNLISFPAGNSNEVLYGNGVWGALPAGATSWQIAGNNLLAVNSGNVGIGTNVPQYKLDVIGDARISNNLYVGGGIVITDKVQAAHEVTTMTMRADSIKMDASKAIYGTTRIEGDIDAKNKMDVQGNATFNGTLRNTVLAGGGDKIVYADINGNLKMGPGGGQPGVNGPCVSGAVPWFEGGNYTSQHSSAGTCNAFDFILKSNNNDRVWIKSSNGNVGVGTSNPTEPFEVNGNGKFGTSVGHVRVGYNSVNAMIDNFGLGAFLFNWYSGKDIGLCLNTGLPGGGGKVAVGNFLSAAQHVEIGDPNFGIASNNAPAGNIALDLHVNHGQAMRIRTYNGALSMYEVINTGVGATTFKVDGNGKTQIGNTTGVTNSALLNVNVNNQDAFEVYDLANNKVNFKVKSNGQTVIGPYISTTNSMLNINAGSGNGLEVISLPGQNTKAISVFNSNSHQYVFTVDPNGYTHIGNLTTANPGSGYKLTVDGKIGAREVLVTLQNPWPDYVFEKNYKLQSLDSVQIYVNENKHLPNIPSAEELKKKESALNIGEMQGKQMEKIEEVYLYLFEMKKEIEELKKENEKLKNKLK